MRARKYEGSDLKIEEEVLASFPESTKHVIKMYKGQRIARLQRPHIILEQGTPLIVDEREFPEINFKTLMQIYKEITKGVEEIHNAGYLHRGPCQTGRHVRKIYNS